MKAEVVSIRVYSESAGGAPEMFFDKPILRGQRIAVRRPIKANATSTEITTIQRFRGWWNSLTMPVPQRT